MNRVFLAAVAVALTASTVEARVVRLRIEHREPVLNGRSFGAAGGYEKLVGKVISDAAYEYFEAAHLSREALEELLTPTEMRSLIATVITDLSGRRPRAKTRHSANSIVDRAALGL